LIDGHWGYLPKELRTPELRAFLESYTKSVVRYLDDAFATGAQRGIEQTAKLLIDPEYYLTLKERRRKWREHTQARERQQEQERRERELCPTAEQIEDLRERLTENIADYERQIESWKERLLALPKNSKHVRMRKPEA